MSRRALMEAVERAKRKNRLPVAVLDVDLTLMENAPRTRAILRDYALSLSSKWPGAFDAAERAESMPLVFSILENLQALGLESSERVNGGINFWKKTFFSNAYCTLDTPFPGAVDTVRHLHRMGCTIAYVTARRVSMLAGTTESFLKHGFPLGVPGTILSLKNDPTQPDKAYKIEALEWIAQLGEVVICAENEPAYINLMHQAFPDAMSVLIDTRHSPSAPALAGGVRRVDSLYSSIQ
jgi:phosphoglycolate phosphatase-like HAD superfamily hydrolase